MSNVDERIVRMQFDNTNFEAGATKAISILDKLSEALKFKDSGASLDSVKKSLNDFNLDSVSDSIEECSSRFSAFDAFVSGIFLRLGSKAADFGLSMAKNLTVKPLMDGFGEYELQMRSVQTILSNTGDKLKAAGFTTQEEQIGLINDKLDELNEYADKTIYNFSEMTRNIGTFTAAGVDLNTATKSIQGIANLAAASGSSSQQASTAMYQLSQAIAAGSVKLQDWNSVVNAGMGGELFQNALKRTARAHGIAVDEMIEKNGSFRESLQEGWITSDVLTDTLEQLTIQIGDVGYETREAGIETLKAQGYTKEEAEAILDLADNAYKAATKVRTWTQLWDTVGEALGSGWATTWRTIVGDFLEATDLFTHLSDGITGVISASADARNAVLADWSAAGGRTALVDGIKYSFDAIMSVVKTIGSAFSDVFGITSEQLYNLSTGFAVFAEKLVPSQEAVQFLYDVLYDVFTIIHSVLGVFGNLFRAALDVAGAVWKLIRPFVKLAAYLAKGVINVIARLSSFVLYLSDRFEDFVYFIMSHFGGAIDFIYGGIGKIIDVFAKMIKSIGGALTIIPALGGAFVSLISQSEPVKFVLDSIKSFGDFVSGKFTGIIDKLVGGFGRSEKATHKAAKELDSMSTMEKVGYFFEGMQSRILSFADEFLKASDKVSFVKDKLSGTFDAIKNKFKGFLDVMSSPLNLYNQLEILDSNFQDFLFDTFDADVADKIWVTYDNIISPFFQFLHKNFADFESWGDWFGYVLDKIKEKSKTLNVITKPIKSLIDYFKKLASSGKSIPNIIATVFIDLYNKVRNATKDIPAFLSKLWEAMKRDFVKLDIFLGSVRDTIADKLREMFKNLPSPQEIGSYIGTFFSNVSSIITDKIGSLKNLKGKFDLSSIFGGVSKAFSGISGAISGFTSAIPVDSIKSSISGAFNAVFGSIGDIVDGIDTDKIKEILDKLIGKITKVIGKRPWVLALLSIGNFLNSLATLNRGIGKFGKGFGKNFRKFGESIGDGLKNFGEGFTKFKKQTKAQAFQRIATGMLILAGALWVLAQIPSNRLIEVAGVLGILALGITTFMLAAAGLAKLGNMDLESTGKGIAGFGIGVLALAGAMWILSKMPAEDVDKNVNRVLKIVGVLGAALFAISASGGNLKGAAAAALAMAVAVTLLVIPIQILGRTPDDVLTKGGIAVGIIAGVLTLAIGLMELANIHKSSIFGAAPTLIALALSITLLMIPIEILGRTDPGVLKQGGFAVGQISAVLAGAIALIGAVGKRGAAILAAAPALLAMAISIGLLTIPIKILGGMNETELQQGGIAVGILTVVMGAAIGLMGLMGLNAVSILAGTVALLGMVAAVGALALVMAGLSAIAAMNPEGMETAIIAVVGILMALTLGLAAIGAVGTGAGIGLAAIAGGILALSIALYALGNAIIFLQTGPDWGAIGSAISGVGSAIMDAFSSVAETVSGALGSALESIGNFLGPIGAAAGDIKDKVVNGVSGLAEKFKLPFADGASSAVKSLTDKVSGAKTAATNMKNGVVNSFKTLKSDLASKAKEGASAFVDNLSAKASAARNAAASLVQAAKGGLTSLYDAFRNVGLNAGAGLANGLASKIKQVGDTAVAMMNTSVNKARAAVQVKSPSRVFMRIGEYMGEGLVIGMNKTQYAVGNSGEAMAQTAVDSVSDTLSTMSIDIEDLLQTDYSPEITPVINATQFNSDLSMLSSAMNGRLNNFSVDNLNYTGELSTKFSDYADTNRQVLEAFANNAIDYNLLGVSVANALINSGLHVEMDGGQMVGYLAGEIRDARRMYVK